MRRTSISFSLNSTAIASASCASTAAAAHSLSKSKRFSSSCAVCILLQYSDCVADPFEICACTLSRAISFVRTRGSHRHPAKKVKHVRQMQELTSCVRALECAISAVEPFILCGLFFQRRAKGVLPLASISSAVSTSATARLWLIIARYVPTACFGHGVHPSIIR